MKFRHQFNREETNSIELYETNTQPSETVPDQTLTIPQILERYARGLPLESNKNPVYEENDPLDGIEFRTLDLSEQMDFLQETRQKVKDINKELHKPKTKLKTEDVPQ